MIVNESAVSLLYKPQNLNRTRSCHDAVLQNIYEICLFVFLFVFFCLHWQRKRQTYVRTCITKMCMLFQSLETYSKPKAVIGRADATGTPSKTALVPVPTMDDCFQIYTLLSIVAQGQTVYRMDCAPVIIVRRYPKASFVTHFTEGC